MVLINLNSSRELRCQCQSYDDEAIDQEKLSDVIRNNANLASPTNYAKVIHIQLTNCQRLNLLLDIEYLDTNIYQLTQLSIVRTASVEIEFRYSNFNKRHDFLST